MRGMSKSIFREKWSAEASHKSSTWILRGVPILESKKSKFDKIQDGVILKIPSIDPLIPIPETPRDPIGALQFATGDKKGEECITRSESTPSK